MHILAIYQVNVNETLNNWSQYRSQNLEFKRSSCDFSIVEKVRWEPSVQIKCERNKRNAKCEKCAVQKQCNQIRYSNDETECEESLQILQKVIIQQRNVLHAEHRSECQPKGKVPQQKTHFVFRENPKQSVHHNESEKWKRHCEHKILFGVLKKECAASSIFQETWVCESIVIGQRQRIIKEIQHFGNSDDAPCIFFDEIQSLECISECT